MSEIRGNETDDETLMVGSEFVNITLNTTPNVALAYTATKYT